VVAVRGKVGSKRSIVDERKIRRSGPHETAARAVETSLSAAGERERDQPVVLEHFRVRDVAKAGVAAAVARKRNGSVSGQSSARGDDCRPRSRFRCETKSASRATIRRNGRAP
jgi:hypothetical protein